MPFLYEWLPLTWKIAPFDCPRLEKPDETGDPSTLVSPWQHVCPPMIKGSIASMGRTCFQCSTLSSRSLRFRGASCYATATLVLVVAVLPDKQHLRLHGTPPNNSVNLFPFISSRQSDNHLAHGGDLSPTISKAAGPSLFYRVVHMIRCRNEGVMVPYRPSLARSAVLCAKSHFPARQSISFFHTYQTVDLFVSREYVHI